MHHIHRLSREDVAFYRQQLPFWRWREADLVEIRFRGHKEDEGQAGHILVLTRKDVWGVGSSLREGGGYVALLVELLCVHPNLSSAAPLGSYRQSEHVVVWSYGQALRVFGR